MKLFYHQRRKLWEEDPKALGRGGRPGADRSAQKGGRRGDLSTALCLFQGQGDVGPVGFDL